jgi:hypothetical protein
MFVVLAATLVHRGDRLACSADTAPTTPPPKAATPRTEPSPPTIDEWDRKRDDRWKKPRIPSPAEIESMTAEAYCFIFPIHDVPPFSVPKKYHRELLKHFENAELDDRASTDDHEMGTMLLRLPNGCNTRICWFWACGRQRLCFSCCGMRYRAVGPPFASDETLAFDVIIRHIHKKEVLHEKD